jgi:hypothetical protein
MSQGLCRGRHVFECDMGLAAHLQGLERNNVENRAIGRKEHVQLAAKILLFELVVEVGEVETAVGKL